VRFVLCVILLAARSGQAGEAAKAWRDWVSEGKSLRANGNYTAAAQAFRQALISAGRSGVDDRQLIGLYHALGSAYADAGQFAESEHEYRRALSLLEKTQGRQSLDYAMVVATMAALPTQTENREDVIAVLREAIADNRQTGPAQDLAIVRGRLAEIFRKAKRYQEEEPLLLEALAGLTKQKSADPHLIGRFLTDLAVLRFDQGRFEESFDLQQQAIRVLETSLGKEHPSLVVPLGNLGTNYTSLGRFDDACNAYQRALDVCTKTLGEDPTYALLLRNYAVVLRKLGRKHEAKKMETESQRIQRAVDRRNGVGSTISLTALRSSAQ
jgi:tetratricopeptide (TPR) repeat protein